MTLFSLSLALDAVKITFFYSFHSQSRYNEGFQGWSFRKLQTNESQAFYYSQIFLVGSSLVTQPMLQHRPNRMELRSMDSYIQILCRFQKCKRKVPPPSPLSTQKSPFTPPKDEKNLPLGVKGDFSLMGSDG